MNLFPTELNSNIFENATHFLQTVAILDHISFKQIDLNFKQAQNENILRCILESRVNSNTVPAIFWKKKIAGWLMTSNFKAHANSVSVILGLREGDNNRLCAMHPRLQLTRYPHLGMKLETARTAQQVGS